MNRLFIFFLLLSYFERNVVFCKYYYVKDGDAADADCSEAKPCTTISAALRECSSYDTVYINGDLKMENSKIFVNDYVTIKSITDGTKVNIPVNYHETSHYDDYCTFNISGHCIMKDFKFTLGYSKEKAPNYCIFFVNYGYLRLENAEFVRDSKKDEEELAPLTKPLFYYEYSSSSNNLYLHSCTFTDIELIDSPLIENVGTNFYNCQFKNIIRNVGDGAVYEGSSYDLDIIDTTFDTCRCLHGDGGALHVSAPEPLICGYNSNTTFKGCTAEYVSEQDQGKNQEETVTAGGAIYFKFDNLFDSDFNISNIIFGSGETANSATVGSNMFFELNYIYKNFNSTYFPLLNSMPDNTKEYAFEFHGAYDTDYYPMQYLLDLSKTKLPTQAFVGGDKYDNDCKEAATPCPNLYNAKSIIKYGNYTITFVGECRSIGESFNRYTHLKNYDTNTKIIPTSGSLSFYGSATIEGLSFYLPAEYTSCLISSYNSYKITLKSLTFKLNDGVSSCAFNDELLSIHGDLEMDGCSFSQIKSLDYEHGLIFLSGDNISINACTFDSCGSLYQGGGLYISNSFSYNVNDNPYYINITSCSFKKCTAKIGGAIYLYFYTNEGYDESDEIKVPNFQFNFEGTTFGSGNDKNIAEYGQNIFLESSHYSSIVSNKYFPMLKGLTNETSVENNIQLYSYAEYAYPSDLDGDEIYNMIYFIRGDYFAGVLHFGGEGDDSKTCKDKSNMCKTFDRAGSLYFNYTDIKIYGELNLTTPTGAPLSNHEFYGENKNTKINIGSYGMLYLSGGVCKNININILSTISSPEDSALIEAAMMKFRNVVFTSDAVSKIESCLILQEDGLDLEDCTFTNISCCYYLFGVSELVSVRNCKFTNINTHYGVFSVESDDDYKFSKKVNLKKENSKRKLRKNGDDDDDYYPYFYLSGCSFTNISADIGSSSSFGSVALSNARINSTTFESCVASGTGFGGALGIGIGDNCWIGGSGKTEFKKCSAYLGGALMIIVESSLNFGLKSLTFGSGDDENKATQGKNIYLYTFVPDIVASYDRFPTLKGAKEDDDNLYKFLSGGDIDDGDIQIESDNLIKLLNGKLKEGPAMLYVGDEGKEGNDCSSADKLCKSTDDLVGKVKYDIFNITVVKSLSLSGDEGLYGIRVAVKGDSAETKIIPDSSCTLSTSFDSSFESLVYEVDELSSNLFEVYGQKLTLSSSSFKAKNSMAYLKSPLIYVHSGGSILMENCNISNFELCDSYTYGTAIHASSSKDCEVIISGVDISNCVNLISSGGGIYGYVYNDSTFRIENSKQQKTSLKKCSAGIYMYEYRRIWSESVASSYYGRGGGILLYVQSNPNKLKVECEFGEEAADKNSAVQGYDIFILAENMKKIMNLDNFPCLKGKGKDYDGAMGYDKSAEDGESPLIDDLYEYAKNNKSGSGFPVWAIVLIVVLVVVVIAVIVIVIVVIVCVVKKKGGDSEKNEEMSGDKKEPADSETNKE